MPLPYHPRPGTIVVCDYAKGGFRPPEMTKRRLAVTVSPKLKRRNDLVTVVPLSATRPSPIETWHVPLDLDVPAPWGDAARWAKCDMVATVGYDRLNLPHFRHHVTGSRQFWQHELSEGIIVELRRAVASALGIVIAD
jgi:uncharacterized protein YifN (PemK superfamily)